MLKNRVILCLLLDGNLFVNSRQFELNPVGDLHAILQYLHFDSIDEIVILNVTRGHKNIDFFARTLTELTQFCFVPITAGGGIESLNDCKLVLDSGADKIVFNSSLFDRQELVKEAIRTYGTQCIIHSMDVRQNKAGKYTVYVDDGIKNTGIDPVTFAQQSEAMGVGEIFLTSIDRDGTSRGYDLALLQNVADTLSIPVIASGGVGHFQHLVDGIRQGHVSAVSAANLFHFIGQGLKKAKSYARAHGLDVPEPLWNFKRDHIA